MLYYREGVPLTETSFTFIDLFAGIGGFHYALQNQGGKGVWASEIDPRTASLYEINHSLKPVGDITQVAAKNIPSHDVLCAGFPCQPFSISGKQNGFSDPRGTLFFDVARIVEFHKPPIVLLENVKNFAQHDQGNTLRTVRHIMENLGYHFYGKLYNASDFGLPQNRQRFIMVAIREDKDTGSPFKFPEPNPTSIVLEDILEPDETVTEFIIHRSDYVLDHNKLLTKKIFKPHKIGQVAAGRQGERIYDPKGYSITLSANGGGIGAKTGLYYVNGHIRKLSPRECARLQGFPEKFILPQSNQLSWKVFGNAVPVNLIEAVVVALKKQNFLP